MTESCTVEVCLPLGKIFCTVSTHTIVPIRVFFVTQSKNYKLLLYNNSIEDSTLCAANLLVELISVRGGICENAIDLNIKEELQFIIDSVCTS